MRIQPTLELRGLLRDWMRHAYEHGNPVEGLKLIHFINTGEMYTTLQSVLRQD